MCPVMVVEVSDNPTIDTAAFATGDQIGALRALDNLLAPDGMGSVLTKVIVIDAAKQSAVLDVVFYYLPVTLVGAENAAADVSDADLAAAYCGHVNILAADYVILNANSAAMKACRIPLKNPGRTASGSAVFVPRHRLYYQLVSRGSPDYDATSLTLRFTVETQN